jgi:hypothetical protein
MAKDKSPLDGVVRFITTDGFDADLQALLTEHVRPALEATGMVLENLPALLENQAYAMMFTAVVEDLMTRDSADGRNITDAYLKRHGWKQGATVKRQLQALRNSQARLYEITAVNPGVGLVLKDLLAPETTETVVAPGLAGVLPVGCPVAVRVLKIDGESVLSAGILPFEENMSAEASAAVREAAGDDVNLAPHITAFWLRKTIEERLAEGGKPAEPASEY